MEPFEFFQTLILHISYWLPGIFIWSIPFYILSIKIPLVKERKPSIWITLLLGWLLLGITSFIFGRKALEKGILLYPFIALLVSLAINTFYIKQVSK